MAINPVFVCGFEEGVDGPHWTTTTGATYVTSGALSGLRSLRCNTAGFTGVGANTVDSFGAGILVLRGRFKFTVLPDLNTLILGLSDSVTGAILNTNGTVSVLSNNTNTNPESGFITTQLGIVYTIDLKIDTTANPWTVDMQVSGIPVQQGRSSTAASVVAKQVRAGFTPGLGITTGDMLVDDIVISTTAADYPIGPGYVHPFVPTADGTHNVASTNDFERSLTGTDIDNTTTTAWQLVDELPMETGTPSDFINLIAPVNATDYVEVVFGPPATIPTPTVAPRGVEVIVASAAATTAANNLRLAINDNGTLDDVRNATVGSTTVVYNRKCYVDPPSAASSWTLSGNGNFNNLRMRCFSSDAIPDAYFVGALIEASFLGPLLTKQTLVNGTDITVGQDLTTGSPTTYALSNDLTETVSSVVTTTISNSTADGEVPQQQCVLTSNGGNDVGTTMLKSGQRIQARVQVSGADTDMGMSGVAS